MGLFSLVLLGTSVGLTIGLAAGGLLKLIGVISTETLWLLVQGSGALGFVASTVVVLRIHFSDVNGNTRSTDEEA